MLLLLRNVLSGEDACEFTHDRAKRKLFLNYILLHEAPIGPSIGLPIDEDLVDGVLIAPAGKGFRPWSNAGFANGSRCRTN